MKNYSDSLLLSTQHECILSEPIILLLKQDTTLFSSTAKFCNTSFVALGTRALQN